MPVYFLQAALDSLLALIFAKIEDIIAHLQTMIPIGEIRGVTKLFIADKQFQTG